MSRVYVIQNALRPVRLCVCVRVYVFIAIFVLKSDYDSIQWANNNNDNSSNIGRVLKMGKNGFFFLTKTALYNNEIITSCWKLDREKWNRTIADVTVDIDRVRVQHHSPFVE